MELSTPGFANSRIRAPPHVHPRSPGSRHGLWRGPNEELFGSTSTQRKQHRHRKQDLEPNVQCQGGYHCTRGEYGACAHRCGGPLSLRPLSPLPCNAAAPKGPAFCLISLSLVSDHLEKSSRRRHSRRRAPPQGRGSYTCHPLSDHQPIGGSLNFDTCSKRQTKTIEKHAETEIGIRSISLLAPFLFPSPFFFLALSSRSWYLRAGHHTTEEEGKLHNKKLPTPCLWQAPASTQKIKRKIRPAIHLSARWRVEGLPSR